MYHDLMGAAGHTLWDAFDSCAIARNCGLTRPASRPLAWTGPCPWAATLALPSCPAGRPPPGEPPSLADSLAEDVASALANMHQITGMLLDYVNRNDEAEETESEGASESERSSWEGCESACDSASDSAGPSMTSTERRVARCQDLPEFTAQRETSIIAWPIDATVRSHLLPFVEKDKDGAEIHASPPASAEPETDDEGVQGGVDRSAATFGGAIKVLCAYLSRETELSQSLNDYVREHPPPRSTFVVPVAAAAAATASAAAGGAGRAEVGARGAPPALVCDDAMGGR